MFNHQQNTESEQCFDAFFLSVLPQWWLNHLDGHDSNNNLPKHRFRHALISIYLKADECVSFMSTWARMLRKEQIGHVQSIKGNGQFTQSECGVSAGLCQACLMLYFI